MTALVAHSGEVLDGGRGGRMYLRVCEGACPHHDRMLERRELFGWCPECELGYSVDSACVTLHGTPENPDSLAVIEPGGSLREMGFWRHASDDSNSDSA